MGDFCRVSTKKDFQRGFLNSFVLKLSMHTTILHTTQSKMWTLSFSLLHTQFTQTHTSLITQPRTHRVHLHACSKVSEFKVSIAVQQHVVWFNVSVDKAQRMDSVQCQHHFCCVELSPLLWDVIVTGQSHQVSTRHELHHQIEVLLILERTAQLHGQRE